MAWTTPRTFVTGEVETASIFNTHLRDNLEAGFPYGTTTQTYTPTLTASTTNPTLGSGSTQSGRYYRIGRWVFVVVLVQFGTSGTAAGSGTYQVSLPISASTDVTVAPAGSGTITDSSAGTNYVVANRIDSATTVRMVYDVGANVTDAAPFAWAASDSIRLFVSYEAA